mgnify:FL=1
MIKIINNQIQFIGFSNSQKIAFMKNCENIYGGDITQAQLITLLKNKLN